MTVTKNAPTSAALPAIGIIMLDTTFPRIVGDIGNPNTFPFPVRYTIVAGASSQRVVINTDPMLPGPFVDAARKLERYGVKAITTSCGFLSIYQQELAEAVNVPVFTSSLLQAHLARAIIRKNQKVGIITARSSSLTRDHLSGVGIQSIPLVIAGMDDARAFTDVFIEGSANIDVQRCRKELVEVARRLVSSYPEVGAVVLECTNMPPFARDIQEAIKRPVFDAVSLVTHAYATVVKPRFL